MSHDWNLGTTESNLKKEPEKAVIVGLITRFENEEQVEEHLDELEFLAETAGATTLKKFTQKMDSPHPKTFIGSGKLEEIAEYCKAKDIDMVIFDDDLSASQVNNIEKQLTIKAVDRSSLILDIFASRAQTAQAKTQVELAQMQYLLPRLRGMWDHLERQRGGIGMRGPGEQEIETDRRIVRDKISKLEDKLAKIDKQAATRRKQRGELIRVALVGYTNVGKSTLMNVLSKSDVFAENKLFATLDTTVRKVVLGRTPFLLSDTVGFIRKLPHHLVESFKTTLDEVKENDILLHIVDISHSQYEEHIAAVNETLNSLEVTDKKIIYVFNKIDLYRKKYFDDLLEEEEKKHIENELLENLQKTYDAPVILTSAISGENIQELRAMLKSEVIDQYEQRYPWRSREWS